MREFMKLVEDQQDFITKAHAAVDEAGVPEQVVLDLEEGDFGIEINYIEVPEDFRGQGWGDKVMAVLGHLADQMNITLVLTAADEDLEDWYWKHGFEGGRHMTRKPHGQTQ